MRAGALHDTFELLDGNKRWTLPGIARVSAGLSSNVDTMSTPGDADQTSQVNEAAGQVQVQLTMWTHEQWEKYQHVLARLRNGTKDGPAVFTCAHPEVRARRIKRLYFKSEDASPYSPREGYKVTLTFTEQLKSKQKVASAGGGLDFLASYDAFGGSGGGTPSTSEGQAIYQAAVAHATSAPKPTGNGVSNAYPGYCSAWTRLVWQETHGGDRSLFGGSAVETEGRFKKAGQYITWTLAAQQSLRAGDLVFYPPTKKIPAGHVGIYDGNGGVLGNNFVTYKQRGGLFDASGKPTGRDAHGKPVDARGTVPIGNLGTPSGIGKPVKVQRQTLQGPAAPLPAARPSANVPGPR